MSIRKKVTLLFVVSLVLMGVIAVWAERSSLQKGLMLQKERYLKEARGLFSLLSLADERRLRSRLQELGFKRLPSDELLEEGDTVLVRPHSFGEMRIVRKGRRLYLYLRYLDRTLLVYDTSQESGIQERYITYALVGLDILLLVFFYLLVLRIFAPLRTIASKMSRFASGELGIRAGLDTDDEIGEVARSFDTMAGRLQRALKSREELLRDVGHELRTPIARGKFLMASLPDFQAKEELASVFSDLERLSKEILGMHLLESEESLHTERFSVQTLIADALNLLYVAESDLVIEAEDFEIEGDRHYLAVALKNLLDNALKYRKRGSVVKLEASEGSIDIYSEGEPIESDATRRVKNREGHGFGLIIVEKILSLHGFALAYAYETPYNRFSIRFIRSPLP
ncbi:HAMP domain-containing protein [Hydrogenimonas sp.]